MKIAPFSVHPEQTAQQRSDITTNEPHSSSLFLLQERFVLFDHLLDLSLLTAQRKPRCPNLQLTSRNNHDSFLSVFCALRWLAVGIGLRMNNGSFFISLIFSSSAASTSSSGSTHCSDATSSSPFRFRTFLLLLRFLGVKLGCHGFLCRSCNNERVVGAVSA